MSGEIQSHLTEIKTHSTHSNDIYTANAHSNNVTPATSPKYDMNKRTMNLENAHECMFEADGRPMKFGVGARQTLTPFWLASLILALYIPSTFASRPPGLVYRL
eukprot:jgi/Mesvir1/20138/Mv13377-RA.1